MRLLFVADGRSPIALNWIDYFLQRDDEVHLVSTFPCAADPRLASFTFIPVAFSELKKTPSQSGAAASRPAKSIWGAPAVRLRTLARQWLGPLTLSRAAQRLRAGYRPAATRPGARHAHPVRGHVGVDCRTGRVPDPPLPTASHS